MIAVVTGRFWKGRLCGESKRESSPCTHLLDRVFRHTIGWGYTKAAGGPVDRT